MSLTLREAVAAGQLKEFVANQELSGVGPISVQKFDTAAQILITPPPPQDQTSGSPFRGGSRGK
jgi:hypothetical protein